MRLMFFHYLLSSSIWQISWTTYKFNTIFYIFTLELFFTISTNDWIRKSMSFIFSNLSSVPLGLNLMIVLNTFAFFLYYCAEKYSWSNNLKSTLKTQHYPLYYLWLNSEAIICYQEMYSIINSLFLQIKGNINICITYLKCPWEIVDSQWMVIAIEFFFVKPVCMVSDSN